MQRKDAYPSGMDPENNDDVRQIETVRPEEHEVTLTGDGSEAARIVQGLKLLRAELLRDAAMGAANAQESQAVERLIGEIESPDFSQS